MASPQKENGFTPIANEILEALAKIRIRGQAYRVLMVILRKTYGFQKIKDRISLSQIVSMANMRKQHADRELKYLRDLNIVTKFGYGIYGFNKDYDTWNEYPRKGTKYPIMGTGVTNNGYEKSPLLGTTKEKRNYTKEITGASPDLEKTITAVQKLAQVSDSFQIKLGDPTAWVMKIIRDYKVNMSFLIFRIGQFYKRIKDSGKDYGDTMGYLIKSLTDLTWFNGVEEYQERPVDQYLQMMEDS